MKLKLDKIIPALLIATGIFSLGLFIKAGFDNFSYQIGRAHV